MKTIYYKYIFLLAISALASCTNNADNPELSVIADKLQVSVGETVTFTINHDAVAVAIYTGDDGHDYQTSADYLLKGKTDEDIQNNNYRPIDPDVVPYSCDLSESQAGSATVANGLAEVRDANSGDNLIGSQAAIELDASLQKNVLKIVSTHPDWWYQALRLNTNTNLGTNKTLTLRMRFEKDVLEDIYSGEKHPEIATFPVVIRLAGIGIGESEVTFSNETVWDIYWSPNTSYTDYSVELASIIDTWQVGTGKTMKTLSYIQILFTASGSVGYVGDYFVESATYGGIDYIPFSTGQALPVNDDSGVLTYQYMYSEPGNYKVMVVGSNVSMKDYSGDGYKDDRGSNISASEYKYNTQYSTVDITVNP
ncbi:DUF5017 domain-containing protein [Bacteroides sp. OttesenSCG-928-D19]|nr:DUF5017 domain-containing protein [Bacteroides sp. OttesenSCG-928-N06]MDL2303822.1 DUF5017 domain-containing protein [Bacteroides sp. OttesenSCG-928-D19]